MEVDGKHGAPAGPEESSGVAGAVPAESDPEATGARREARPEGEWFGRESRVPEPDRIAFTHGFDIGWEGAWIPSEEGPKPEAGPE